MDFVDSVEFTSSLLNFCTSNFFKKKQSHIKNFDLSAYLNAFENWVEY